MADSKQALLNCARCHAARYCSKACQVEAWPRHKREVCDLVQSWIAGVAVDRGYKHMGACTAEQIAFARTQYPPCEDSVFITFHSFTRPDGSPAIARYHLHPPNGPPCVEKGTIRCRTTIEAGKLVTSSVCAAEPAAVAAEADALD
jgi:hypothetical protein